MFECYCRICSLHRAYVRMYTFSLLIFRESQTIVCRVCFTRLASSVRPARCCFRIRIFYGSWRYADRGDCERETRESLSPLSRESFVWRAHLASSSRVCVGGGASLSHSSHVQSTLVYPAQTVTEVTVVTLHCPLLRRPGVPRSSLRVAKVASQPQCCTRWSYRASSSSPGSTSWLG